MTTRLQSVTFINPVFFDGQSRKQTLAAYGAALTYDEKRGLVIAVPPPSRKKPTVVIPMTNVAHFEEVDEEAELVKAVAQEAAANERIRQAATLTPAEKTKHLKGVEKLIKNSKTGQIEIVQE